MAISHVVFAPSALAACAPTGTQPDAPLSSFSSNPTQTTCQTAGLTYVQRYEGMEQFKNTLVDTWNRMAQSLRSMTAQLHAVLHDQNRNLGAAMDASLQLSVQRLLQKEEMDAVVRYMPSELSCSAGSFTATQAQAQHTARAISRALRHDYTRDIAAASGTPAGSGGEGAVRNVRWENYCLYFRTDEDNQGRHGCSDNVEKMAENAIPDGDIDVEGLLFGDTIDLEKPEQRLAAATLLRNLIGAHNFPLIPESVVGLASGRQIILQQQHLLALRNVVAEAVSSMIARRAAINGVDVREEIQEIRKAAGIPVERISMRPSYNEIMLAMTKERFMDPEYYIRTTDNIGAIRQEQTMVQAYTTLQLQDIYEMQELINTISAARAAIKLNRLPTSELSTQTPLSTGAEGSP